MSVPFYSDESEPIHRKLPSSDEILSSKLPSIVKHELDTIIKWINNHNFSKVVFDFTLPLKTNYIHSFRT